MTMLQWLHMCEIIYVNWCNCTIHHSLEFGGSYKMDFHLFYRVFSLNITTVDEKWPVDFVNKQTEKMYTQNWIMGNPIRESAEWRKFNHFFMLTILWREKSNNKKCDRMKHQFAINWIRWVPPEAVVVFGQQLSRCKSREMTMANYLNKVKFTKIKPSECMFHQLCRKWKNYWCDIIDWWNAVKTTRHVLISTLIVHFNGFHCVFNQLTWHWDKLTTSTMIDSILGKNDTTPWNEWKKWASNFN